MLVLSRRSQERIYLDDGRIEVAVLKVEGNRVRLGITAPPEVSIRRGELQPRVEREELERQELRSLPSNTLLAGSKLASQ